jgi:sulfhydrogenase subunit alpha
VTNKTSKKTININVPVLARVEGEGALDLRIEDGSITDLKLRIFEPPRYFEKFLEGRSYRDVLDTVARICGICPVAYQMTAVQALESIFLINQENTQESTQISPWTKDMRRVMYCGEWLQSHSLHIHMLAAPDFLGVNSIIEMARDNDEAVRRGLRLQTLGNDLIALFGARSVHPVGVCVGGFSRAPEPAAVSAMVQRLATARQDAEAVVRWVASLDLPHDDQDFTSVSLRHSHDYPIEAGRIVSDRGLDIAAGEFEQYFTEHHIPHSTALHCLLQGQPYLLGPLARLNLNLDRLPAESRALLDETGIEFPSRNMFHSIIARAIEMHVVVCDAWRLLQDYQRPDQAAVDVTPMAGTGFACTEAPRGLLWHRYDLDESGMVKTARIVPPTSQNQARIEQDLKQSLINVGLDNDQDVLRLHAEKVIRNYDPCISCATHFLTLSIQDATHHGVKDKLVNPRPMDDEQLTTAVSVLVIGIGSPHGSDSLGWEVIRALQQDKVLSQQPGLSLFCMDRPGIHLLDVMKSSDRVILVDAVATEQPLGSLVRLAMEDIKAGDSKMSTHGIGLAETLEIGRTLQQLPQQILVLGLETGGDLNWHYSQVELKQLTNAVRAEIQQHAVAVG